MPKFYSYYPHAQIAYSKISSVLLGIETKRAIDFGCSDFHNYPMFKTDFYIGADLDIENLKKGLEAHKNENCIACLVDLAALPQLKDLADLVVCTFTLIFFPSKKRLEIVAQLCDYTKAEGHLVLEAPNSPDVCLLYTSPSPRDATLSRMPSSA